MDEMRVLRESLLYGGRLYHRGDVITAPVDPDRLAAWVRNGVVTPGAPREPEAAAEKEEHSNPSIVTGSQPSELEEPQPDKTPKTPKAPKTAGK